MANRTWPVFATRWRKGRPNRYMVSKVKSAHAGTGLNNQLASRLPFRAGWGWRPRNDPAAQTSIQTTGRKEGNPYIRGAVSWWLSRGLFKASGFSEREPMNRVLIYRFVDADHKRFRPSLFTTRPGRKGHEEN